MPFGPGLYGLKCLCPTRRFAAIAPMLIGTRMTSRAPRSRVRSVVWEGWEKSLPFGTDAGAPEGVAIPTCRASCIPSPHAPLSARGNPRISVLIRAAAACRRRPLLEGAALVLGVPRCLVRGGTSSEGASVERHLLFVTLSLFFLVSFLFPVGHVLAVAPAFYFSRLLYGVVALFIKRGESLFRG